MKNLDKLERIGLLLLTLGGLFFLSENFFRLDFLNDVYNYARFLFSIGAIIWAFGYMRRAKSNREQ